MTEELRAEPAPRFRCKCGTEDLITREKDGTLIDEMRCPGCDRIWKLTKLSSGTPVWTSRETYLGLEGDGPPVGKEPKPMPFPEAPPSTPHLKCVCGRHLDTRSSNGKPWYETRCVGTYGCWRTWRLSDSFDGDGNVWLGRGSGGQAPWEAVRLERNAPKPTVREKRLAQKPLKLRGVPCEICDGSGYDDATQAACVRCGGYGEIM